MLSTETEPSDPSDESDSTFSPSAYVEDSEISFGPIPGDDDDGDTTLP